MTQETKTKQTTKKSQPEVETEQVEDQRNQELTEGIEDLLDEIDVLLGEVGEEFALQFVQKGGQ